MAKYRDRVEIIVDILKAACSRGTKKTRIMYAANLSHALMKKYLDETVALGFIDLNDEGYEVTERGQMFLKRCVDFPNKYSEIAGELQNMRLEREALRKMCALPGESQLKSVVAEKAARRDLCAKTAS